jgi:hypothetical protein
MIGAILMKFGLAPQTQRILAIRLSLYRSIKGRRYAQVVSTVPAAAGVL